VKVPCPSGVLVPRTLVAAPVSPGVRAVSMFLAVAPRARVAVPVDPGERAVPMLFVVAPRAHISTPASPNVRAMSMSLAIAPRACVGASINAYDVSPNSLGRSADAACVRVLENVFS